jgi:hypothetical protein
VSTALGLSAVTAVLQCLLYSVYHNSNSILANVKVTGVAPDLVTSSTGGTGSDAPLQVNVFLHQVTPNAALRNLDLPSVASDGFTRLTNPPLALDLHYLLTVYASKDGEAEALLGYAVQLLHDNPVLTRGQIRSILANVPATNPLAGPALLGASGVADQIEMLKISPATLGREEMAWLWTALKSDYRPTFPFQVSVVLIQTPMQVTAPLPVLSRQVKAQPNFLPVGPALSSVAPPNGNPAAMPGDTVVVTGANFTGASGISLVNARAGFAQTLPVLAGGTDSSLTFLVPNPPAASPPTDIPAGVYLLCVEVAQGSDTLVSNGLPLALAPIITPAPPTSITRDALGNATVSVQCAPFVRAGQEVFLAIGAQAAPPQAFAAPTNALTFTFAALTPTAAAVPIRLQVDGIEGPVINFAASPPAYTGPLVEVN